MHVARPIPLPTPRPSHWRAALVAAALVLAAHALVLWRNLPPPGPERRVDGARPMLVRQILAPPAPLPAATVVAAAAAPIARPRGDAAASAHARAADLPGRGRTTTAAVPAAADAGGLAVSGTPLPAYATELPPAATLRFALRRGGTHGVAELRWRPTGGRYLLTLDSSGLGGQPLGATSQGGIDAGGMTPDRYTEGRRGREARAVNFQHETGRITFSGPSLQYPLLPGAQDRLSWMLQLPAVMQAEPALREPGSEVMMFVVGTRGDAEVWIFTVQSRATVHTAGGPVADALHLRREPRRPYDTQVDAWLDPARHHLPVQLHLHHPPGRVGVEFVLEQHTAP